MADALSPQQAPGRLYASDRRRTGLAIRQLQQQRVDLPDLPPGGGGPMSSVLLTGVGPVEGGANQLMPSGWELTPLWGSVPVTAIDNAYGQSEPTVSEVGWYSVRATLQWGSFPTTCTAIRAHVRVPSSGAPPAMEQATLRYGFRSDGWHAAAVWGAICTVSTGWVHIDPGVDGRVLLEVMAEGTVVGSSLTATRSAAVPPDTALIITRLA